MNNVDDIHSLAAAYAIDAVDDVERARFDEHLPDCPECQSEVKSMCEAAGQLSAATVAAPPPSLRESLLREVHAVRPFPPAVTPPAEPTLPAPSSLESKRSERARRTPVRQWLVGVAAAAILATGGAVWHPWSSVTNTVQLTATQQVLQAKDSQRFEQKVGEATATVVRSPSLNQAVIVTANMPAPPKGKVYELWLQQGSAMVSAGLMPSGTNTVLLKGDATKAQGVGITVEPPGGSVKPTLPPLALISLA